MNVNKKELKKLNHHQAAQLPDQNTVTASLDYRIETWEDHYYDMLIKNRGEPVLKMGFNMLKKQNREILPFFQQAYLATFHPKAISLSI